MEGEEEADNALGEQELEEELGMFYDDLEEEWLEEEEEHWFVCACQHWWNRYFDDFLIQSMHLLNKKDTILDIT